MNTSPQDNPYGEQLPMNVMQEMSHGNPAGIPISQSEVSRSRLACFTRPRSSDSAPVRGQDGPVNVGNTPTMRFTGDTAQMSGMRVVSGYYDRIQMPARPNGDPGHTMPQDNSYGEQLPMNVMQEMSHGNPAGIPINQPEVSSSRLASFTRPRSSDSAPVGVGNWPCKAGNTPTMRFAGVTAQMNRMSVGSSDYDLIETSASPNTDPVHTMSLPSFHQSWSSPGFPSIHQAQSFFVTQSSDPAKFSPHTSSFHGSEHTMGITSAYPNQPVDSIQNPYHHHLQPSVGTPSSVQAGHSSGSTRIYESGISGGSHYDLAPPTISDMCTASYDQVRPSFITPDVYGYEHTTGISTSYSNEPTVSYQNPYHTVVQPSIGMVSQVHAQTPSPAWAGIDKSAPSIDTSSEDHEDSSKESKRFECQVCQKKFRFRFHLERHAMVHTTERPFECEVCPLKFARRDHLKQHYDRIHLAVKRFICEVCARSFYSRWELDTHVCNMNNLRVI